MAPVGCNVRENGQSDASMFDEPSTFHTQLNLYRGKGLAESHDLALFLQLYNGTPLVRRTGVRFTSGIGVIIVYCILVL